MTFLGLGVGVVDPTTHNLDFSGLDLHSPERKCFRGVEFGPLHFFEQVVWIRERNLERRKIEIQRAEITAREIKP